MHTRAALWPLLPLRRQAQLLRSLKSYAAKRRNELVRELASADASDGIAIQLHIALLDMRLKWMDERTKISA